MADKSSLREQVYLEIPGNRDYSAVQKANAYLKAGELARDHKYYDLAYHCFGCVAGIFEEKGLGKLLGSKYHSLAGDMAKLEGSSYYAQQAGFAYAKAGNKNKLEAHLRDLGYSEERIHPSTWMYHARFLAEENSGGYSP